MGGRGRGGERGGGLLDEMEWIVSHGLGLGGTNFLYSSPDEPTIIRLGLGQNQKMTSLSCYIHMICVKNGYAFLSEWVY